MQAFTSKQLMGLLMGLAFLLALAAASWGAPVVYKLPFPAGASYRVYQGNSADLNGDQQPDREGDHGCFRIYRICDPKATYAFDFAMPEGSQVVAAAEGIVSRLRSDSTRGGCFPTYAQDENYVLIDHADGTSTLYLHLQPNSVRVKVGDRVPQGKVIAHSGKTGWCCGAPHLHFQRQGRGKDWETPSLPIRFTDVVENNGVPIATHSYASGNLVPFESCSWGAPVLIEAASGSALFPRVAMNGKRDAIVVWQQMDAAATRTDIYANRYSPSAGWGTAKLIGKDAWNVMASHVHVAMDADGNAIAVWTSICSGGPENIRGCILANRYMSATGWGTAQIIDVDPNAGGESSGYPYVAMNANGNAIVVWEQWAYVGYWDKYFIFANRCSPRTGWGEPTLISNLDLVGYAMYPEVAMDANGNAIAVWVQVPYEVSNVYANRYSPGSGWGAAECIGGPPDWGTSLFPQVAMDADGDAVAVWRQGDFGIGANGYTPRRGRGTWGTARLIEGSGVAVSATNVAMAMAGNGNAILIWDQWNPAGSWHDIYASRYTPGSGWGAAECVLSSPPWPPPLISFTEPDVALDWNGNAVAVWEQSEPFSPSHIYASQFE